MTCHDVRVVGVSSLRPIHLVTWSFLMSEQLSVIRPCQCSSSGKNKSAYQPCSLCSTRPPALTQLRCKRFWHKDYCNLYLFIPSICYVDVEQLEVRGLCWRNKRRCLRCHYDDICDVIDRFPQLHLCERRWYSFSQLGHWVKYFLTYLTVSWRQAGLSGLCLEWVLYESVQWMTD